MGSASGRTGTTVLAVDVGNSKTDVALVEATGRVLAAVRGETVAHQRVPVDAAFVRFVALAERVALAAGLDPAARPLAALTGYSAAGADYPSDVALLRRHLRGTRLASADIVVNDCFGALRAGAARGWGVVVICGTGMNCAGVAPNGRIVRFDGLGALSGDWGGGAAIGYAAIGAAVRAQDGRGPATALERIVPTHYGVGRPRDVAEGFYLGRIARGRNRELAPLVFDAASSGDRLAREIVDRQADEVVAFATAAIRRLRLVRVDPDVVLAGGVFSTRDAAFHERIVRGVQAVSPRASVAPLRLPPVAGAALLALDRLHGGTTPLDVEARLRRELTAEALAASAAS